MQSIYPGTPITWLPDWVAYGWRLALWVFLAYLVITMTIRSVKGDMPLLAYGRAALVLFMLQELILDAERLGDPLTYEGVPISTLAAFFTWRAMIVSAHAPVVTVDPEALP